MTDLETTSSRSRQDLDVIEPKGELLAISWPAPLVLALNNPNRRRSAIDFVPDGSWLPPARIGPATTAALDAAIEQTQRHLAPAGRPYAKELLTRVAAAALLPDKPERAWTIVMDDLVGELSIYPEDIIAAVVKSWQKHSKFFPHLSDLVGLLEPLMSRRLRTLRKLRVLQQVAEYPSPDAPALTFDWWYEIQKRANWSRAADRPRGMRQIGDAASAAVEEIAP